MTLPRLQAWIDRLVEEKRGRATIGYARLALKMALSEACLSGSIPFNIMHSAQLRLPRFRRSSIVIPTKDQVARLVAACRGPFQIIVYMTIFTGLRQGELRGLTWDNIDFENSLIRVTKAAGTRKTLTGEAAGLRRTKTEAGVREIAIGDNLRRILSAWKRECPTSALNLVFPSQVGTIINAATFRGSKWIPALKRAGLLDEKGTPLFHFHALRHVQASLFIEQGMPPKQLQRMMGHTSIKMTFDRYGHVYDSYSQARAAIANIEAELGLLPAPA